MSLQQYSAEIRGLQTGWWSSTGPEVGKPVLFFIHGFPDDIESWRAQLDLFSGLGYPVVAPYLRGCGPSLRAPDKKRYGRDAVLLDHLEILRQAGEKWGERGIVVIGHDIGGLHAWALARALGSRLKGLVLINAPDIGQLFLRLKSVKQIAKSWYIGAFLIPGIAEKWFGLQGERTIRGARKKGGLKDSHPMPGDVSPLLNHYRAAFADFAQILLKKPEPVFAPVIALVGKDDAFLEVPTMAEFKHYAPQAELRVLDGNHWLQIEQKDQVNRIIQRFVEGASRVS